MIELFFCLFFIITAYLCTLLLNHNINVKYWIRIHCFILSGTRISTKRDILWKHYAMETLFLNELKHIHFISFSSKCVNILVVLAVCFGPYSTSRYTRHAVKAIVHGLTAILRMCTVNVVKECRTG